VNLSFIRGHHEPLFLPKRFYKPNRCGDKEHDNSPSIPETLSDSLQTPKAFFG
jgi:hypothetical protein